MSDELLAEARRAVSEQGRQMIEQGLTKGVGGNISQRGADDLIAISPTGIPYDRISPDMVPVVDVHGERHDSDGLEPSSELPMHTGIFRNRPDIGAVVHTHSPYATTFGSLGQSIPPSHYLVSFVGDKIPVAGYATPGSEALATEAIEALGDEYEACLLQNHGVISVGSDAEQALETALMVEFCARIHYQATCIGNPVMVPDESINELRAGLDEYRERK